MVYYATKQLGFSAGHASLVYGIYAGFVYFSPIVGGAIADRWLGRRRHIDPERAPAAFAIDRESGMRRLS